MAANRKLSLAALTAISAIAALPAGAQAKADDDRRDQPQAETHATESHDGGLQDVTNEHADHGDHPAPQPAPRPTPQPAPQPAPQPNDAPDVVAPTRSADGVVQVVTPRSAVESRRATNAARRGSRRSFRIRIRRGVKVKRAQVWVDGHEVKVTHGVRTTAPVDLRGMPDRTVTVRIRVRTRDGHILEGIRTYRTFGPTRPPGKHNQP